MKYNNNFLVSKWKNLQTSNHSITYWNPFYFSVLLLDSYVFYVIYLFINFLCSIPCSFSVFYGINMPLIPLNQTQTAGTGPP